MSCLRKFIPFSLIPLSALACTLAWADASPIGKTAPPQHAAPAPTRWTNAPEKHNGSGIGLRHSVPQSLQPGQPATVLLRLNRVTHEGAQVDIRSDNTDVQITHNGQALRTPIALPRSPKQTIAVQVTAPEGTHELLVFIRQNGRSSAHTLPLQVGTAQTRRRPQAQGTVHTTPSGEKVISLPSQ